MATLTKRMVIRFTNDDDAWIASQAEHEGLEPATFVRALVTRMRRGLPALIGMSADTQPMVTAPPAPDLMPEFDAGPVDPDNVLSVLDQRAAEAADSIPTPFPTVPPATPDLSHETAIAAFPLRRLERTRYNPGRSGYG